VCSSDLADLRWLVANVTIGDRFVVTDTRDVINLSSAGQVA
jgi:hypothetical protein